MWKKIADWVMTKTVTIPAVVAAIINLAVLFGADLDADQIAGINAVIAAILALFSTGTVTANTRLGDGDVWGGYGGKDETV